MNRETSGRELGYGASGEAHVEWSALLGLQFPFAPLPPFVFQEYPAEYSLLVEFAAQSQELGAYAGEREVWERETGFVPQFESAQLATEAQARIHTAVAKGCSHLATVLEIPSALGYGNKLSSPVAAAAMGYKLFQQLPLDQGVTEYIVTKPPVLGVHKNKYYLIKMGELAASN